MDNKQRYELFALIEYCRTHNHNIGEFIKAEKPDWQSEKLDIGIEVTSAVLQGEFKAIAESGVFSYWTSHASDPNRLLEIVHRKTKKFNTLYKRFAMNVLFIRVSSNFGGTNYFSMCGINRCYVSKCLKSDDCKTCQRYGKYNSCFEDDCKKHKICPVGAFVRVLQKASIEGNSKFNPIILSQIEEDSSCFCCWIIDTDNHTITERLGKRVLLESENDIITGFKER
ncbi:MAG: hypothetical protein FWG70_04130 [Oscillospiraceae bacterium]|nr:hypothetical protein [Oscillospiraceae bacterium]